MVYLARMPMNMLPSRAQKKCEDRRIDMVEVDTMAELGKACSGIEGCGGLCHEIYTELDGEGYPAYNDQSIG